MIVRFTAAQEKKYGATEVLHASLLESHVAQKEKNTAHTPKCVLPTAVYTTKTPIKFGVNLLKHAKTNVIAAKKDPQPVSAQVEQPTPIHHVTHLDPNNAANNSGVKNATHVLKMKSLAASVTQMCSSLQKDLMNMYL